MQQFVISGLKSNVSIVSKLELVTAFWLSHKICCEIILKMFTLIFIKPKFL